MRKKRIFFNAAMSIVQVIAISATLFILYRYLLHSLGPSQLGIWSLVLATTSITQIASLGLSGGVVKFVAKYLALKDSRKAAEVIQTAALSIGSLLLLVILACYPVARWALHLVVTKEFLSLALAILPFSLIALWILIITGIFQSGLDGHQLNYVRSLLLIFGAILQLILAYLLTPRFGLIGLAYTRIIQNSSILILSWIILRRSFRELPVIPCKFNRTLFNEMIRYGINFQFLSLLTMFFEPATKMLLSKFGNLAMVGYYEMANRLVQQVRALMVSANQVLVPAIADLKEVLPDRIKAVYLTSYRLIYYLAIPVFSAIMIGLPLISLIWIGRYESNFISFGTMISFGWMLNTLIGPAYFSNLGTGDMRWNVLGTLIISILNICLGFLLGSIFDGWGIILATSIALSLGSMSISFAFHLNNKLHFKELVPGTSRPMTIVCSSAIFLSIVLRSVFRARFLAFPVPAAIFILLSILILTFMYRHPMRQQLFIWITKDLLKKA